MTPTLTRRPRSTPLRLLGGNLLVSGAVAAVLVVAVLLAPEMRLPRFVDRVTIANPTVYGLEVQVRASERAGWLDVGGVNRESTRVSYGLIDQGRNWVFRFSYGGQDVGQVATSRSELQAMGWRLTVPREVADRLRAAGHGPSAQ